MLASCKHFQGQKDPQSSASRRTTGNQQASRAFGSGCLDGWGLPWPPSCDFLARRESVEVNWILLGSRCQRESKGAAACLPSQSVVLAQMVQSGTVW